MTLPDQILNACPGTFFDLCAKIPGNQGLVADEIERLVTAKRLLVEMRGHHAMYSAAPVQAELWGEKA